MAIWKNNLFLAENLLYSNMLLCSMYLAVLMEVSRSHYFWNAAYNNFIVVKAKRGNI